MESDDEEVAITFPELSASSSRSSPQGRNGSPRAKDARTTFRSKAGASSPDLVAGASSLSQHSHGSHSQMKKKSITHKRELIAAARRVHPSMTSSAPAIFWNTEGSLKNVCTTFLYPPTHVIICA